MRGLVLALLLLSAAPAWAQPELRSGGFGATPPRPITSSNVDADTNALDVFVKGGGAGGGAVWPDGVTWARTGTSANVSCTSGCAGGTTDTDDGAVAGGQSTGLSLGLAYVWDGAGWVRAPGDTTNGAKVSLTNASVAVTGTFWQATQPISAASLPLPTGAATSALQGGGLPAALGAGGGLKVDGSGTALPVSGTVAVSHGDPCATTLATPLPISTTANTQLVAASGSKHVYICSIHVVVGAATNVAIVSGTGATCVTNTAGVFGGATAATGWILAANSGLATGNGGRMIGRTVAAGDALCIFVSAANQVSGALTYIQQ